MPSVISTEHDSGPGAFDGALGQVAGCAALVEEEGKGDVGSEGGG